MDETLYQMIFKRKSFHVMKSGKSIEESELKKIEEAFHAFTPLWDNIKVGLKIVKKEEVGVTRGEYALLLYSEKKEGYLQNIGYIGEQLDLYLASLNIGACWYGFGRTNIKEENMDFVIMLLIEKEDEASFRKDMYKSKRKGLDEIWTGEALELSDVVRFAPSACNTQPWRVEFRDNALNIFRVKGKRGIIPLNKLSYYNKIDMGIFLLFIELSLKHFGFSFKRELFSDASEEREDVLYAKYKINKNNE